MRTLIATGLLASVCIQAASAADPPVVVEMDTTAGKITLELYADKAPKTVENFLQYAKDGHYEGTIFHRVIDGFMIQGGGMTPDLKEKETRAPIKNESANGLENDPYTIAMARTPDPDSATSQFFINLADNSFLDRRRAADGVGYAVFGKVVDGKEVVDKIAKVPTQPKGLHGDVPVKDIVIQSVEVKKAS